MVKNIDKEDIHELSLKNNLTIRDIERDMKECFDTLEFDTFSLREIYSLPRNLQPIMKGNNLAENVNTENTYKKVKRENNTGNQ